MIERVEAARRRLVEIAAREGWVWVDHDRFVSYGLRRPGWAHVGVVMDDLLGVKLAAGSGWIGTTSVERDVVRNVVATVDTNDAYRLIAQDEWPATAFVAVGTVLFKELEHLEDVVPTLAAMLDAAMREAGAAVVDALRPIVDRIDEDWRPYVAAIVALAKQPDVTFVARADAASATFVHGPTNRTMRLERGDDGSLIVLTYLVGAEGRPLSDDNKKVAHAMANLADALPEVQLLKIEPPIGPGIAFAAVLDATATADEVVATVEQHMTWSSMCAALLDMDR